MRKVVVFVSWRDADRVSLAIAETGGMRVGNYSQSVSRAITQGGYGSLRAADESKIEFACDDKTYTAIIEAIYDVVPRYTVTVDSWEMETFAAYR